MKESVSHRFDDESIEAKARWFKSLSIEERMDVFVAFTKFILKVNPDVVNQKKRPALRDVRVLTANSNSDSED